MIRRGGRRARLLSQTYGALSAATALGAIVGTAGLELTVGTPRDVLPADARTFLELLLHNTSVALWPLALAVLAWPARPGTRLVGDLLGAAQLLAHGLLVGSAWAEYPGLWRYLPHLPLEWLAIALGVAGWAHARTGQATRRDLALTGAAAAAALIPAAALETWAVPL